MNGPAWALLAWHAAIFVFFVRAARKALGGPVKHRIQARLVVGVIGLMALAPCVIIPACARPGHQAGLARLVLYLSMPAMLFLTLSIFYPGTLRDGPRKS